MEEETYTREPTSGDRLRRYNSTTMSLLRRRETGKANLAGKVQLARIEKQVCVCVVCGVGFGGGRTVCMCVHIHISTSPQEIFTTDTESGLCVQ